MLSAAKKRFPFYRQIHDYGCAAACMRMVDEWLTGDRRTEHYWRKSLGMTAKGIRLQTIQQFLADVQARSGDAVEIFVLNAEAFAKRIEKGPAKLRPDTIYLAFLDAFNAKGGNDYHLSVVLEFFRADSAGTPRRVLLLADPLGEEPRAEAARAFLEQRVHCAFEIRKRR